MAILTLMSAVIAYLYPPLFLPVKGYFLWLFAATMFTVGLVLPLEEANAALKDPKSIGIGFYYCGLCAWGDGIECDSLTCRFF